MVKKHIEGFWKWFWIAMAGVILAVIWYFVITFGLSSYYEKQGNSNYYNEKYEHAIDAYETALTFTPSNVRLYNVLGYTYYMNYNDEKALTVFAKGLELEPANSDINFNMGLMYYNKKEYKKALGFYHKVLEVKPNDSGTYYMIGMIHDGEEQYAEAIKSYEKLMMLDPEHEYVYNALANAYSSLNQNEKAEELYLKHIEKFSNDYIGYTNLYELQLTENKPFDEIIKIAYIERFSEDKNAFIAYDMLKILEDISKGKTVDIEAWKETYHETSLGGWRFHKLEAWVDRFDEGQQKEKLKEAIAIFKSHEIEEN